MSIKFTFKDRLNKHNNDCWCDAIALLTKQPYDKVYKMFNHLTDKDGEMPGGLNTLIQNGYLQSIGYDIFDQEITLYEALQMYDTKNGIILNVMSNKDDDKHVIYVENGVIHDTVENFEILAYIEAYKVESIAVKILKDFTFLGDDKDA